MDKEIKSVRKHHPEMIDSKTCYEIITEAGMFRDPEMHILTLNDLSRLPGADVLYIKYTNYNIHLLKYGHFMGYFMEILAFVIGELIHKSAATIHTVTPLSTVHFFQAVGWAVIIMLGLLFIAMI